MARSRGWNSKAIADEVAQALQLGDDLIINEVRTAESRREAIHRLKQLQEDVAVALEIVLREKKIVEEPQRHRGSPGMD